MAALSSTVAHHRARIAALSRDRQPDDPDLLDARRDLAYERLAEHVRKVVDTAPPATPEQLCRIAGILQAGATGAKAVA
ncbi:hypothetical protein [Mycobacterium sp.]|uniref:hypothetical protein n=1 Tax=Mycobacterium sp. TaxID=1785 RepID=UPI003D6AAE6F